MMWDDGNGSGIDNLSYVSPASGGKAVNNRLNHIIDHTAAHGEGSSVVTKSPENRSYRAIVNQIGDATEGLTWITWMPYNTIRELVNTNATPATGTTTHRYLYAAAGNRVVKDYYPFGMQMDTKTWEAGGAAGHRYGYNGKENDDEVKGQGNQQDYGFRIYDPHVARFLSVHPLTREYASWTSYAFAMDRPIGFIDLEGLEAVPAYVHPATELWKSAGNNTVTAKKVEEKTWNGIVMAGRLGAYALIFGSGVLTVVASGGAALPVVLGVASIDGGSMTFGLYVQARYDEADKVPTPASGLAMVSINYVVGDQVFSESAITSSEFVEGVVSLNLGALKELSRVSSLKKADAAYSILSVTVFVLEGIPAIGELLSGIMGEVNRDDRLHPRLDNTSAACKPELANEKKKSE